MNIAVGDDSTAAGLGSLLLKACRMDVVAFKPGNVSLCSPGHNMQARDFLLSAEVAVPALCVAGASVGERIESAIGATHDAVGCNTNLGIVLLLAPLAVAASSGSGPDLRSRLRAVLARLSLADSEACYRAIRRARPGGLGRVDAEDVHAPPTLDLRRAMGLAAKVDRIAAAYCDDYAEIFDGAVQSLRDYRRRWHSLAWACTACYLELLAADADSHIVRKAGSTLAAEVSAGARAVVSGLKACENPRLFLAELKAFDKELKTRGVNPGTCADLTVASVSVLLLQERLQLK